MGFLSSIPILSLSGGIFGVSTSLLVIIIFLFFWGCVLMILHPLHAVIFILAALCEYLVISLFGVHIVYNIISFVIFFLLFLAIYYFWLRLHLPMPKSQIELLIKISELKQKNLLTEEEFKKAKKRLLKP